MHPFPNPLFARGLGAVAFVTSGSGPSTGMDFNISTVGLQTGDYMFILSYNVADGVSAVTGGTGTGWTLDSATQANGVKNRIQRKRLEAGDINTTLTCKVSTSATPVAYFVFRNVSSADLLETVSTAAFATNIVFSPVVNVTSALFAVVSQYTGATVVWTAPSLAWSDTITAPGCVADRLDTLVNYPSSLTFTPDTPDASGQTGVLYSLTGF